MKKILLLVLVLLLALPLRYDEPRGTVVLQNGNTSGNISNGGDATEDENYCYFAVSYGDKVLYRASKDFKTVERIAGCMHGFCELNIRDGYIYFTDGSPNGLQKMSLDTKWSRHITFREVGNVHISGERIFYRASDFDEDWGKVYSCNLDGSSRRFLAKKVSEFCVDGDTVYYCNMQDGYTLWAMDTHGRNKRKLVDKYAFSLNIDEKYIYYLDGDNLKIFRTDKETLQTECINDEPSEGINVAGDWIYYANRNDKKSLYRISKDGKTKERLADGDAVAINVVSDTVFFSRMADRSEDWGRYKLDLNTRQLVKLADW